MLKFLLVVGMMAIVKCAVDAFFQSESIVTSDTDPLSDCKDESSSEDTSITEMSVSVSEGGSAGVEVGCVDRMSS